LSSDVKNATAIALGLVLGSGCTKLTDQELCALEGQFAAGADITATGKTIHCTPVTNVQDSCNVEIERKFARRGLVLAGYRFFETEGAKANADQEALLGLSTCIAKYPCTGNSCGK
jgi:hypothetical protein